MLLPCVRIWDRIMGLSGSSEGLRFKIGATGGLRTGSKGILCSSVVYFFPLVAKESYVPVLYFST